MQRDVRRRRIASRAPRPTTAATRPPITLVAVSKTFPAEAIEPVLAAGQRVFGENYVQEAKAKWPALRERYPDVELHMIGPLQSNKAREAVELFDVIHTLDRPSLAEALAKEIAKQGEAAAPAGAGEHRRGAAEGRRHAPARSTPFSRPAASRYGLAIEGLMCIPPAEDPPSPHFALLNTHRQAARAARRSPWA